MSLPSSRCQFDSGYLHDKKMTASLMVKRWCETPKMLVRFFRGQQQIINICRYSTMVSASACQAEDASSILVIYSNIKNIKRGTQVGEGGRLLIC